MLAVAQISASARIDPDQTCLNGVLIGDAATWYDVAELIAKRLGQHFTGKGIQRYASEGPRGFYVTFRLPDNSEA
jgi:hypothetical protein